MAIKKPKKPKKLTQEQHDEQDRNDLSQIVDQLSRDCMLAGYDMSMIASMYLRSSILLHSRIISNNSPKEKEEFKESVKELYNKALNEAIK